MSVHLAVLPPYRGASVADPGWVRGFCQAMEAAGVESVWAVEHVVVPAAYASTYPYAESGRMPLAPGDPIPDPLEWIAFAAGATERLRFGTGILILPEHNPVHLAKRLATIDVLSGGRLMLGIGVGWMAEEFDAVGVPYRERGARTDEHVAVMRALWADDIVSFHGRFTTLDRVGSHPHPVQTGGVPIIVGGHSAAAARRAGRLGDGFFPLGATDGLPLLLDELQAAASAAGRDPASIELTVSSPPDAASARAARDLGAVRFVLSAKPGASPEEAAASVWRYRDRVEM